MTELNKSELNKSELNKSGSENPKKRARTIRFVCNPKDKEKRKLPDVGTMHNLDDIQNPQNHKKPRKEQIDWNRWVAASNTRNYLLKDGFLDFLMMKGHAVAKLGDKYQDALVKIINTTASNEPSNFTAAVISHGQKFEHRVIELLYTVLGATNIVNIGGNLNPRSEDKYLQTVKAITDGIPVIYQGVLRNYTNETYGVPDLIIRSDWINKFLSSPALTKQEESNPSGLLSQSETETYHYRIVDIKYTTLHLTADGVHMLNSGSTPAYKGQLCVYNDALAQIQQYDPCIAHILGWKWKYTCRGVEKEGDSCFDRLGKIDFKGRDGDYKKRTVEAIAWIRDVRTNGDSWDLTEVPLPRENLYPNMCNPLDYPYGGIKEKFADQIKDITMLWMCGPKQRKLAHSKGIYKWTDPKCTTETVGINGDFTSKVLGQILEANKTGNRKNIIPETIKNNIGNWKSPQVIEFFVDFEMTCSILCDFDELPKSQGENLIFMIGVGYYNHHDATWMYKSFIVDRVCKEEEFRICSEFNTYVKEASDKYGVDPLVYHWSNAETSAWKRAFCRHFERARNWYDISWYDLLHLFKNDVEPLGVKGCLGYGLKEIAKTFYASGLIQTTWDGTSSCADGADAAVGAYRAYKESQHLKVPFSSLVQVKEIEKYNAVDCKVLEEILRYLRDNHI